MSQIFVRIRLRGNADKYRKLLSVDSNIYPKVKEIIQGSVKYAPQTLLEESEWYFVKDFSRSGYATDIIFEGFDTVDFDMLEAADISKIEYLFVEEGDALYFQNIGRSRLIRRKTIFQIGEGFRYDEKSMSIVLNEIPDAIYSKTEDILYFRKVSAITGIFRGIEQLYREATERETADFLSQSFIVLKDNFSSRHVKTANRKRIALAEDTLSHLPDMDKKQIFSYIGEYCPNLKSTDHSFEVGSEDDLKMLLFGIEQRFYTTPVGKEKRIANSVIALGG